MLIGSLYRSWLGGPGVYMGVGTIVTAAVFGIGFHYLRQYRGLRISVWSLLAVGLLVHTCSLLWVVALVLGGLLPLVIGCGVASPGEQFGDITIKKEKNDTVIEPPPDGDKIWYQIVW